MAMASVTVVEFLTEVEAVETGEPPSHQQMSIGYVDGWRMQEVSIRPTLGEFGGNCPSLLLPPPLRCLDGILSCQWSGSIDTDDLSFEASPLSR